LEVAALEAVAHNRSVPLKILDIEQSNSKQASTGQASTSTFRGSGMVLSRPDQHVAWRGESLPDDPLALIDRIRGAANQTSHAEIGRAA
jgi:hypothetical protein